jgi:predicted HTH transcriptional regulator
MYLNYFCENECFPDENKPIGIILCADKNEEVVRYTLGNMNHKIFVSRYKTQLPSELKLQEEMQKSKKIFENKEYYNLITVDKTYIDRLSVLKTMASKQKKITISQYINKVKTSKATANRDITQAQKEGWLKKCGNGRSTHYVFIDKAIL